MYTYVINEYLSQSVWNTLEGVKEYAMRRYSNDHIVEHIKIYKLELASTASYVKEPVWDDKL